MIQSLGDMPCKNLSYWTGYKILFHCKNTITGILMEDFPECQAAICNRSLRFS